MAQQSQSRLLPAIQPLTARSVVLSTLLGYDPPALPVRALVRVGGLFDIPERTIRVAITRMVADGDLEGDRLSYRLTGRLLGRQRRQRDSISPRTGPWDGTWEMAVVTAGARPLSERMKLRKAMAELRLAELREGVWLRPANLLRDPDDVVIDQCAFFTSMPQQPPAELIHTLWDLPAWAAEARRLIQELHEAGTLATGFMATAEAIRHLLIDPALPDDLLPPDWPGQALRDRYVDFNNSYAATLRRYSEGEGAGRTVVD